MWVAGVGVVAAGLLALGAVVGWWVRGWLDGSPAEVAVRVDRPIVQSAPLAKASTMPNVIGLSEEEARRVLADASVAAERIEIAEVARAGRSGRVVSQQPGAGEELAGRVRLGVAGPAEVPDLVGEPLEAARDSLEKLGARVVVERQYEAGVAEGQVLAVEPAAGERLPDEVTLMVAAAPSSVFLTAVEPVVDDCYDDEVSVDGQPVSNALVCEETFDGDPRAMEYALNREVSRLRAVLGQSDRAATGRTARFRFLADGDEVARYDVAFGERRQVEVQLEGVLRLRIEVGEINRPQECCDDELTAVLGEARLIGAPAAIDRLTDDSS